MPVWLACVSLVVVVASWIWRVLDTALAILLTVVVVFSARARGVRKPG
jgi:hypothetical protein